MKHIVKHLVIQYIIIYNYQFQEQDMIQELVVHVDDSDGYPKYVFEKYSLM